SVIFEFALESHFEPLRGRAKKVLLEEQVHALHGEGWVRRLARTGGAVRGSLQAALERAWLETLCWFGPTDDPRGKLLQDGGILAGEPEDLRQRWLQHVGPALLETELASAFALQPAPDGRWMVTSVLPWEKWDAARRRLEQEPAHA
ncbi:MAG TPA: Phenylacetic acid catabolic protein, partial [Ktedonobacterales bacterium]